MRRAGRLPWIRGWYGARDGPCLGCSPMQTAPLVSALCSLLLGSPGRPLTQPCGCTQREGEPTALPCCTGPSLCSWMRCDRPVLHRACPLPHVPWTLGVLKGTEWGLYYGVVPPHGRPTEGPPAGGSTGCSQPPLCRVCPVTQAGSVCSACARQLPVILVRPSARGG